MNIIGFSSIGEKIQMRQLLVFIVTLGFLFGSGSLHAREFGGIDFPDKIALPGTNKTVQLNGVGYRKKFFVKVYIGALYTESLARSRDEVIAMKGPGRVMLHFLHDEVSSEKLVDAWNEGFEQNLSEEGLEKFRSQIDDFNAMFPTVVKGDVVYIDYIPGTGTRVAINAEKKGVISGRDFYNALLDIWLGKEPADTGLRKAMLGG
ncbi:MAG: chalcone isomerase family protein [Gammaproteobacteria bacterium]|nr:chalcone isomerase family protein [Gammaproteobacteria bacterium]